MIFRLRLLRAFSKNNSKKTMIMNILMSGDIVNIIHLLIMEDVIMGTLSGIALILQLGMGLFWSLVYLIIIKRGFQDKTYGMPMVALCVNISWEFIFSFLYPQEGIQHVINILWFFLDVFILIQFLKYGKNYFKKYLPANFFIPTFLITLTLSFFAVLNITNEFNDWEGKYAAFSQNFMMSILFVVMLIRRDSVAGQSMYAAIFKMLGSLLPAILFYFIYSSVLITFLSVSTFLFDWIYIIFLYKKFCKMGLNPWRRSTSYSHICSSCKSA